MPCGHGYWDVVTTSETDVPSPEAATWDLDFYAPQPVMDSTYDITNAANPDAILRTCELAAVVCAAACVTANASDYLFR